MWKKISRKADYASFIRNPLNATKASSAKAAKPQREERF